MIRYTSQHQLRIADFKTPFEQSLSPDNRWVILANVLPWDEMAGVYHRQMSSDMGRGTIDTRVVIGAMVIKHILKLDDREVVHTLQENIYLLINPYSKIQLKEANQRNHVEGQFGTDKDAYDLSKVKAKTETTSESWIANIFFIINIVKLLKLAQKAIATSVCLFLIRLKSTIFQHRFTHEYNSYRFYG